MSLTKEKVKEGWGELEKSLFVKYNNNIRTLFDENNHESCYKLSEEILNKSR